MPCYYYVFIKINRSFFFSLSLFSHHCPLLKPSIRMRLKKILVCCTFFSVDGFRAVVERHLEVEVTGFDRNGNPIKVDATGWQARILQHECDHLDGTIYVDKFVPRTFRTVENLDLPLPVGCVQLGVRQL